MAFVTSLPTRGFLSAAHHHRHTGLQGTGSVSVCRWRASVTVDDHVKDVERYLRDIAKCEKPPYLDALIHVLLLSDGVQVVPPSARTNLHPFMIPMVRDDAQQRITGLLRWPTPPDDFALPVVTCRFDDPCLTLLSSSVKDHVTRAVAEADFSGNLALRDGIRASSSLAVAYQNGEADKSGMGVERYLTMTTLGFPDIYEGLARFHLTKGDESSALVTCERATRSQQGWGRAQAFLAEILNEVGRDMECRDAARFCLQLPLWTIGNSERVREMGRMAGYQDETSLGKIYRRLYEDGRAEEIAEGKAPEQVALDRAAWLLDLCVAEGSGSGTGWEEVREKLAELYDEAGMNDFATFVRY